MNRLKPKTMKTKLLKSLMALATMLFFTANANSIETLRSHESTSPMKKMDGTVRNLISETSKNSTIEFSLTSFTLVDSETNEDLYPLTEGLRIDMATIIGKKLNIRANTEGDISNVFVEFHLIGPINEVVHSENFAPFALFGDSNGDYSGKELQEGNYEIYAAAVHRLLNESTTMVISFTIVGSPRITGVEATMDLNLEEYIGNHEKYPTDHLNVSFQIEDGALYDRSQQSTLPSIPPFAFKTALIAQPNNGVGSVNLQLSGPITINRTENVPPYSLFGDINGNLNYSNGPFPTGAYTLVMTPYSEPHRQGDRGEVLTTTFTIKDDVIVKPKILDVVYGLGGDGGPFDGGYSIMIPTEPFTEQPSAIVALGNTITKSVEMVLTSNNGFSYDTVENLSPLGFSLFGTETYPSGVLGPSYPPPPLSRGTYTLTMIPYSGVDKQGVVGETITKHFEFVVNEGINFFEYSNETYNFDRFFPIFNGVHFNNSSLTDNHFTLPVAIKAITYPEEVGSVKFEIENENGFSYSRIENVSPYTLFGDSNGVFNTRLLPEGTYHLTATPYTEAEGQGLAGMTHTISFKILEGNYILNGAGLIDAKSLNFLDELLSADDGNVTLSSLVKNATVVLDYDCINGPCPGSVSMFLSGRLSWSRVENEPPFALFGDISGNFMGRTLTTGEYTLTFTPYTMDDGMGIAGRTTTADFRIVNTFNDKHSSVILYPNPTTAAAFVKTDGDSPIYKTVVYDIAGKIVKEYSKSIDSEQAIDVSGLKKGIYVVQIFTGNERITKKLLVQ